MKKVLLIAAVAVFGLSNVNAQEEDNTMGFSNGDVFATGAVGFGSSSQGDSKSNSFTVSPKVGFFVSDNIAVGVSIGYTSITDEELGFNPITGNEITIEDKISQLNAGVFGRYYVTPANQFSFFGQLSADYVTAKSERDFVNGEDKYDGFDIAFAPGISYFVSKCLTLEASIGVLGYSTTKQDIEGAEARNDFAIGLNLSDINFGVSYKF